MLPPTSLCPPPSLCHFATIFSRTHPLKGKFTRIYPPQKIQDTSMGTFRANSLANPMPPLINVFSTHILRQLSRKPIPPAGVSTTCTTPPLINVFSTDPHDHGVVTVGDIHVSTTCTTPPLLLLMCSHHLVSRTRLLFASPRYTCNTPTLINVFSSSGFQGADLVLSFCIVVVNGKAAVGCFHLFCPNPILKKHAKKK
jgi:hypothetical protein